MEKPMDFIERIFGIAPDHGSGFLEMAIIFAFASTPAIFFAIRRSLQRRSSRRNI
jgi:hypothetical protein